MTLKTEATITEKEQAILDAATDLFLQNGYGQTSMDAIAARAGVAKQTIYSYFSGKESLFSAIIKRHCGKFFQPLFSVWESEASPSEAILQFARHVMHTMLTDNTLSLYRLVVAETPRFPELGEAFYVSGPENALTTLASYLEEQNRKGGIRIEDARAGAEYFFGMLLHYAHIRCLLLGDYTLTQEEIEDHIQKVIPAFLKLGSE